MRRFLRTEEAAKLLGVSKEVVYKWVRRGIVEGFKVGNAPNSPLFIDLLSIPAFKREKIKNLQNRMGIKEFAEELGVSERTVRRWIKKGLIKAEFKDGRYFISSSNLYEV